MIEIDFTKPVDENVVEKKRYGAINPDLYSSSYSSSFNDSDSFVYCPYIPLVTKSCVEDLHVASREYATTSTENDMPSIFYESYYKEVVKNEKP